MLWLDFQVAAGLEPTQPQAVVCLPLTRTSSALAAQSIHQQDEVEKLKGVASLIRYATLSTYMLVPTEEKSLEKYRYPESIPHYGTRGWCRVEFFIFALWCVPPPSFSISHLPAPPPPKPLVA